MLENIYNKLISEIESIDSSEFGFGTEGAIVKDREELRKIIEEPCLPACLSLYDKNIQTVNSSANKREIGGFAYIGINFDSLDDTNKRILEKLILDGKINKPRLSDNKNDRGGRDVIIQVPVFKEDTVGKVSDRFMQIISSFQLQDVLYGRHDVNTLMQQLVDGYSDFLNPDEEGNVEFEKAKDLITILYPNFVYDETLDIFWETQDLYNKHISFNRNFKPNETIHKDEI